jgi:hypothetical protein
MWLSLQSQARREITRDVHRRLCVSPALDKGKCQFIDPEPLVSSHCLCVDFRSELPNNNSEFMNISARPSELLTKKHQPILYLVRGLRKAIPALPHLSHSPERIVAVAAKVKRWVWTLNGLRVLTATW